ITTATIKFYTLSLHDALPILIRHIVPLISRQSGTSVLCISPWRKFLPSLIYPQKIRRNWFVGNRLREPRSRWPCAAGWFWPLQRSEEHTSELQSRFDLVCRLL